MEIDEIDGNEGHTYCLKKINEKHEVLIAEREINETNFIKNKTEELILLV